jgi:plastocyanin
MKLLLAVLALAATPVDPRAGGLEVGMGEWAMAPEAPAIRPGPVTVVVRNNGRFVHGFRIKGDDGESGGDRFEARSISLKPGQVTRVKVTLPAGVYSVECFVEGHDDRGMETRFEVRANAPLVKPKSAAGNAARIEGFAFRPGTITVNAGATVRWANRDAAPHTVTAANGSFTSKTLAKGGVYTRRFPKAGRYGYLCALHPGMKGAVLVR